MMNVTTVAAIYRTSETESEILLEPKGLEQLHPLTDATFVLIRYVYAQFTLPMTSCLSLR